MMQAAEDPSVDHGAPGDDLDELTVSMPSFTARTLLETNES